CWVFYGSDAISGRVTAYYATCLQRGTDGRCTAIGRTLDPSVFQISTALQRVDSLSENGEAAQLRSCTVLSKKDWRCRASSDDSFELGFSGGRPWVRIHEAPVSDL